jgi:hypothetical protein
VSNQRTTRKHFTDQNSSAVATKKGKG